jgi:hypothetical protein
MAAPSRAKAPTWFFDRYLDASGWSFRPEMIPHPRWRSSPPNRTPPYALPAPRSASASLRPLALTLAHRGMSYWNWVHGGLVVLLLRRRRPTCRNRCRMTTSAILAAAQAAANWLALRRCAQWWWRAIPPATAIRARAHVSSTCRRRTRSLSSPLLATAGRAS